MATKNKSVWILIIFILSGIVFGGLVGELASKINGLWWLGYGETFGLQNPIILDFSIVKLTLGLVFKLNIASILGMVLGIIIYKSI